MAVRPIVEESLSHMLPTSVCQKGWTLYWESPLPEADPIILRDSRSRELHRWDYTPSLTELFEVCKELEENSGGALGRIRR